MGNKNNSLPVYDKPKEFTLDTFKDEIKRKMTIHILSNNSKDCIKFIELLTNEKVVNSNELLEENIEKKVNLFSFMNYKIYEDAKNLANKIIEKIDYAFDNPEIAIFSEVIVFLHNSNIKAQITEIKEIFESKKIWKKKYLYPFLIIISPDEINLKGFLNSKTFHYKISLENISYYIEEILQQQKIEKEKKNKEKEKKDKEKDKKERMKNNEEISSLFRKLNVLFSYYNELGDEFSFINYEKKNN